MENRSIRPLAVVTGASSGIGYELARQCAEHGHDLVICAEDEGIAVAASHLQAIGITVEPVQADLSQHEGVERLYGALRGRAVDVMAINAGVGVSGDFSTETSLTEELEMINLNVISTVHLAKLVARDMVAQGHGRMLFTSSIAAVMPTPYLAVYGATKAFIFNFAEALREELKGAGVTVTALLPGATDTRFFTRAHMEDTKAAAKKKEDPAEVARQGYEALMKGTDHVFAGTVLDKLQGAMSRIMPETIKAAQHGRELRPGSAGEGRGTIH